MLTQSPLGRQGLALPSAMFALVAVSVLVVGLFTFTDLGAKASRNRERAARATHVAEAGIAHAVGTLRGPLRMHHFGRILRGSDSSANTADDTLLIGWGLPGSEQIPAAGKTVQGGTYFVSVRDDPADGDALPLTDLNGRVLLRCRAETPEGAVAEIETIVGAIPFPGVATDGTLEVPGNPQIQGACGGAHANGNLVDGGSMTVTTLASATGTVSGDVSPRQNGAPPIEIPSLNPLEHCAGAEYVLKANGYVVITATGDSVDARGSEYLGWKRSGSAPVKWDLSGDNSANGTFCVHGNVVVGGNTGTEANPRRMSIIATGSMVVSGNPWMRPEHDDGIMLLAGGDLSISGNPGITDAYQGLIYAGADCNIAGQPAITGQVVCKNNPDPGGSINLLDKMEISGNPTIRFDCSANVFNKRRVLFWYPKLGA